MKYIIKVLVYFIITILTFFCMFQIANAFEWNIFKKEIVKAEEIKVYKEGDEIPVEVIREIISRYATGTKAYQIERTIYCESNNKNVQSYIVKNGIREESYGIAQIHLPSHNITKEQALDPEYSINFMSERWEDTKWYGYLRLEDKCNII